MPILMLFAVLALGIWSLLGDRNPPCPRCRSTMQRGPDIAGRELYDCPICGAGWEEVRE